MASPENENSHYPKWPFTKKTGHDTQMGHYSKWPLHDRFPK